MSVGKTPSKKLDSILNDLEKLLASPSLYLSEYFSNLRSDVDIQCELCIHENELNRNEVIKLQTRLISEINKFETTCTFTISDELIKQMRSSIEGINLDLSHDSLLSNNKIAEIIETSERIIELVQKELFNNKSIIYQKDGINLELNTGILIFVDEQFISQRAFDNLR